VSFEELKARQAAAWSGGRWDDIAGQLAPMHDDLVARLEPRPGERWLDVGTGTGAVALRAARAGADVIGLDLAPGMIENARRRAAEEGLDTRFDVGDAEALPYEDASFDVVSSAVGVFLTPDHRASARELARVCRPGGRLGLTAWRPGTEPFATYRRFGPAPQPDVGDAEDWGREEYVASLLGDAFELRFESGNSPFVGPSGEEMWQRSLSAGPTQALVSSLDDEQREGLHRSIVEYLERHRVDDGVRAPAEYLVILGTRREASSG
jgi:SAM-dependent methyltransferase